MKRFIDIEIGDSVWIMHDNVPRKGTIRKIVYMKFRDYFDNDKLKEQVTYYVCIKTETRILTFPFQENEMYASKEDLKNALLLDNSTKTYKIQKKDADPEGFGRIYREACGGPIDICGGEHSGVEYVISTDQGFPTLTIRYYKIEPHESVYYGQDFVRLDVPSFGEYKMHVRRQGLTYSHRFNGKDDYIYGDERHKYGRKYSIGELKRIACEIIDVLDHDEETLEQVERFFCFSGDKKDKK